MNFQIISTNLKAFWSNEDGWVEQEAATIFTEDERYSLNLPCDGLWIPTTFPTPTTIAELILFLSQFPQHMPVGMKHNNPTKTDGVVITVHGVDCDNNWVEHDFDTETYKLCFDNRFSLENPA
jgi:hypothetical protein